MFITLSVHENSPSSLQFKGRRVEKRLEGEGLRRGSGEGDEREKGDLGKGVGEMGWVGGGEVGGKGLGRG